jgi:hypothetical protein
MTASSISPQTLPRLQLSDVGYLGAFRLPRTTQGDTFSFAGRAMAFNPARNSLFISSRLGNVAEVDIPAPMQSSNVSEMPFANYLQAFRDPTEGHFREIANDGASLSGLLVHGDRLYGTGSIFYDATNSQVVSHFSHATDLSQSSFKGMSQVWETNKAGFVAGYMANIPSEWHTALGGPALTGQCCIPIITRTSAGPAAFAWNPSDVEVTQSVSASPLLYYPAEHATLGPWNGSNEWYGGSTAMGGAAVIAGTRTVLFIGRNGAGEFCYGNGTSIQALAGTLAPDGEPYCYDPTSSDKGQHAYPYRYQIWAYDLNDFAAVKAGAKQPWDVKPYGVWPFALPVPEPSVRIGGVAYDAQRQIVYLLQMQGDQDGYEYRPLVHALKMNVTAASPVAPAPAPAPAPGVSSVTLTSNKPSPQPTGAAVQWTAQPNGGTAPHEFKWFAYANGAWSVVGDWTTSNTFQWTPTSLAADGRFGVWVRSAGNGENALEASAEQAFVIASATSETVSSVVLTSSTQAPQGAGSTIRWTAVPAGGGGSYLYKWWVNDGNVWTPSSGWVASNTYDWTPANPNANYRVGVWVKRSSNAADALEASAEKPFAIGMAAPVRPTSVVLTTSLAAPQAPGTPITVTANAGAGSFQYKWFINNNGWIAVTGWVSSNTYLWTPGAANPNYILGVWVRMAGSSTDAPEVSAEKPFPISTAIVSTTGPVSAVSLTSNIVPTTIGAPVTWTATSSGGPAPHQYQWWVFDDKWNAVGTWTTSNTFTWTPTAANANYRIGVWVRGGSSTANAAEASVEVAAPIK